MFLKIHTKWYNYWHDSTLIFLKIHAKLRHNWKQFLWGRSQQLLECSWWWDSRSWCSWQLQLVSVGRSNFSGCVASCWLWEPAGSSESPGTSIQMGAGRISAHCIGGVVVGLQGVCCTGRASSRPLQGVPHLDREVWCQASCCSNGCSNPCFLEVSQRGSSSCRNWVERDLKAGMPSATGMKARAASSGIRHGSAWVCPSPRW